MKHEYHEGRQTGENFEKLVRAVIQIPRVANPKQPTRKPTRRKTTGSDNT